VLDVQVLPLYRRHSHKVVLVVVYYELLDGKFDGLLYYLLEAVLFLN
jgi:hypothetical protein